MRCVNRDGWIIVEVVRRSCSYGRGGEWLRVKRGGYHFAEDRTVEELAGLGIDLAYLKEGELLTVPSACYPGALRGAWLARMSSPRLTPAGIHRATRSMSAPARAVSDAWSTSCAASGPTGAGRQTRHMPANCAYGW
jgi:hypothetical protein